jgi:predicted acetyltransferase
MTDEHIELIEPTPRLRESHAGLVQEFVSRGEKLIPFVLEFPAADADGLMRLFQDAKTGIGLPEGFVPHSTFWLVRNGECVLGVSNLRHRLTPKLEREGGHIGYGVRPSERRKGYGTRLLHETLVAAKARGISRALLTCARTNRGSVQVIRRNGGVFDSEEFLPDRKEVVQRYWIDLRLT